MDEAQLSQIMNSMMARVMAGDLPGFDLMVDGFSEETCRMVLKGYGRQAAQAMQAMGQKTGG